MKFTREMIGDQTNSSNPTIRGLAMQLLIEMDKPRLPEIDWESRPWATEVRVGYCSKSMRGDEIGDRILTIKRPRSYIDDIVDNYAGMKYINNQGILCNVGDAVKSAILKILNEVKK